MTTKLTEDLLQAALEVRQQAYAPFSQFLVGAALKTTTGEILIAFSSMSLFFANNN